MVTPIVITIEEAVIFLIRVDMTYGVAGVNRMPHFVFEQTFYFVFD